MKALIPCINPDLQNILLWLLLQDFMVIVRGSLAHGGMYMWFGDIVQLNAWGPHEPWESCNASFPVFRYKRISEVWSQPENHEKRLGDTLKDCRVHLIYDTP